ncbi:polysaccharide transporter [Rhodoferax aquaticus]|uniref:Polysaccharide transporter n=2 Tax=Rhodoferax aquaticus TaxID=2527691 RepID=A0A515EVE5_9BURK|nr:polysaccharide transporter [Rhodoferax aquaticus]
MLLCAWPVASLAQSAVPVAPRVVQLPLVTTWAADLAATPASPVPQGSLLAAEGVLSSSTVGAGDQVLITVFGQPDMSAEVTVNDNQQVTLPLIGTLKVGGLVPFAIEKLVAQRLREGEYLRSPEVSVQVRQVRSQMVSVLGEVQRPGRFALSGKLSVWDALATAGGLTPRADRVAVLVRRVAPNASSPSGARQEIQIALDQIVDLGKLGPDLELQNDDVVFVGVQKQFYVHGEVRRPGAYPMEPGLTLMRALAISGGVTERGSMRRIRVHRTDGEQKTQEFVPDLSSPIVGGDVVYVNERLF